MKKRPTLTRRKTPNAPEAEPVRIHKLLADAGIGSRREIERWIGEGRITVNGRPAEVGERLTGTEKLAIDGRPVRINEPSRHRYLAYHKPADEVCTRATRRAAARCSIRLPRLRGQRWIAVGRLDVSTTGLLLFTTDGALANALMHPSGEVLREYAVRVMGEPDEEVVGKADRRRAAGRRHGLVRHGRARGGEGRNRWYHVTLREGRNREVRRLWEAVGFTVSRLSRVAYGPVKLDRQLSRGRFRDLEASEVRALYECGPTARAEHRAGRCPRAEAAPQAPRARPSSGRAAPTGRRSSGPVTPRLSGPSRYRYTPRISSGVFSRSGSSPDKPRRASPSASRRD
jgi:23S rRNA pseudouridine2605 synthase